MTERGVILPSKMYTVDEPHGHHVLTVVDYTPVERVLTQKSHEKCPDGADTCLGLHESGLGYWKDEYAEGSITQSPRWSSTRTSGSRS